MSNDLPAGDLPWPLADLWPIPPVQPGTPYIAGAARNVLARAGIRNGQELAKLSTADLLLIPGVGPGIVKETERALCAAYDVPLAGDELTGWEPGGIYTDTWRETAKAQDAAVRAHRDRIRDTGNDNG